MHAPIIVLWQVPINPETAITQMLKVPSFPFVRFTQLANVTECYYRGKINSFPQHHMPHASHRRPHGADQGMQDLQTALNEIK